MTCNNFITSPQFLIIGIAFTLLVGFCLDADTLNITGNYITAAASIWLTIAAQKAVIEAKQAKSSQLDQLKEQLRLLQDQIANYK